MTRPRRKDSLCRKVNTQTHGVRRHTGGNYRTDRKADALSELTRSSMHGKHRHGLDYTPLFQFLLSRVGADWDSVYAEAVSRLDRAEPIFLLVARQESERREIVRVGESTYFSGLYIDEAGILRMVNGDRRAEDLDPYCSCCTHTFNGVRFGASS